LLDYVKNGGAFAGAHCATDTFYALPEYGEMVGAYFDGHPWHEKVRMKVEDREHVATKHLGESFEIEDEIYQFKAPFDRAKLHVLTSLDTASVDMKRDGVHRTDGDFATSWTKDFGRGRVFYTGLGHGADVWKDARFEQMLVGGFRWAMRDAGTVTLPKREAELRAFALENKGDPKQGYALFRKTSGTMCIHCHKVNGTGADVGPDLSGIALEYSREEILESILAPSARIEKGYESVSIELTNGTLAFGRVIEEKEGALKLADTNGEMRVIQTSDIAARTTSNVSVMPQGLATTLSNSEFADLVAYVMTLKMPAAK
jgi:putative heme-binding domain-containing protein